MSEMKYKVGDKFLMEIAKVDEKDMFPYIFGNGIRTGECWLNNFEKWDGMTAEEAWKIAKKLFINFSGRELDEIFGNGWTYPKLMELTPQQAKGKIEAWKTGKKVDIGDEITAVDNDGNKISLFVQKITKDTRIKYWGIINYADGTVDVGFISRGSDIKKTGRHIDIKSVLDQIGEAE